jgi:hypothetical protein
LNIPLMSPFRTPICLASMYTQMAEPITMIHMYTLALREFLEHVLALCMTPKHAT